MKTVIADKRWTKKYPHIGTGPVSTESCVSKDFFDIERDKVFKKCWLNIGRIDQIPKCGDYFVQDISICKVSVLVIRGHDDVVRAFHNTCSHRGNKLVRDHQGNCPRALVCGFHNWSYENTGELKSIPDEENFFGIDKLKLGLSRVHLEIWEGFIFINLSEEPEEDLRQYLGGVVEQLGGGHFDPFTPTFEYIIEENANWKVALDAQNEIYHLPFQHRLSIPKPSILKDGRYTRNQEFRIFDRHTVYASEEPERVNRGPVEDTTYQVESSVRDSSAHRPLRIGDLTHRIGASVNGAVQHRLPRIGDFDFYTIFPNFCILLFRGSTRGVTSDNYLTYNFWPLEVGKTLWNIRFYFTPAENAGQRIAQEYSKCLIRDILYEDAGVHETVHEGLSSQAKGEMYLQDEEIQIRYFHEVMDRLCRET